MIIRYRIARSDLWRAYWFPRRRVPLRLLMLVIAFVFVFDGIAFLRDPNAGLIGRLVPAAFCFLLAIAGTPLYPLLRFKPEERTLTIGPAGISTTIGSRAGDVAWPQVAQIAAHGERVYIQGKSGNSFVIPFSAFAGDGEREQFLRLATEWMNGQASST